MTNLPIVSSVPGPLEKARYVPLVKVASGGMATVFVGTLRGPLGFSQLVAIKRPHEHLLEDEAFRRSLLEEARVAAQIRHANVVDVRDIEVVGDSIQLVMDYVEGASLGQLMAATGRAGRKLSPGFVIRVVLDALAGLSAVHDLADADGIPLGLVHRDISPQNILVGVDGLARITDFGIAMAEYGAFNPTTQGTLKGKVGYMAPEYIRGIRPDQRVDVFAMGVVLWEALAGRRLFKGANDADAFDRLLNQQAPRLSSEVPEFAGPLDQVLERALAKAPEKRFQTANSFATALEEAARNTNFMASPAEVAREVRDIVGEKLEKRKQDLRKAQAALEASDAVEEEPSFEYDGTTLKYEPPKAAPTKPPVMAAAIPTSMAAPPLDSHRQRKWGLAMVAILAATLGLVTLVMTTSKQSGTNVAPMDSIVPPNAATSSSVNTPANHSPTNAPPSAVEPMAANSAPTEAPAVTSALAPVKTSNKPSVPATTTKAKTRKLPPNPYGP